MPQPRALFSWLLEAQWLLDSTVRCVYTEETTLLNPRAIRKQLSYDACLLSRKRDKKEFRRTRHHIEADYLRLNAINLVIYNNKNQTHREEEKQL